MLISIHINSYYYPMIPWKTRGFPIDHLALRQTFSSIDTSAPVSTTFELAGAVADQSD